MTDPIGPLFTPRIFMVKTKDGHDLEAEQLATFVHYIRNVGFRFVVTRLRGPFVSVTVTHRASRQSVATLTLPRPGSTRSEIMEAGHAAIEKLILRQVADAVYDVLMKAERATEEAERAES